MLQTLQYRGKLDTVTPTKRSIFEQARVVKPVSNYIVIPAFTEVKAWYGVSNILHRFRYSIPGHNWISLVKLRKVANLDFVPVLSYLLSGTKYSFKLWADNDVKLYLDVYDGRRIPTAFDIEIWCKNANPTINAANIQILTSLISFPGHKNILGTEVGTRRSCEDNTLNLAIQFIPSRGDYWTFDDCGAGTFNAGVVVPPIYDNYIVWIRNVTDGLYYEVKFLNDGGLITLDCQTPSVPPVAGSDHLLLRSDAGTSHKITLMTDGGVVVPIINQTPDPATGADSIILIEPVGMTHHTLSLIEDSGNIVYTINQTPIVP